MLTFRKIEMVEAVIQHRSITEAARAIGISQPAPTQGIKAIEAEYSITLFNRGPRGLEPTAFAGPFARYANEIRGEILATKRDLSPKMGRDAAVLRVQCGLRTRVMWVDRAIHLLAERRLDLKIALTVSHAKFLQNITSDLADVSILPSEIFKKNDAFTITPVGTLHNRFVCRAAHALSVIEDPTLDQLRAFPLAGDRIADRHVAQFGRDLGRLGSLDATLDQFVPAIFAPDLISLIDLVKHSDAIAMLPPELFGRDFADGILTALGEKHVRLAELPTALVYRKDKADDQNIKDFVDCIREAVLERANFFTL